MRLLLTRPRNDSERIAQLLCKSKVDVHIDPLMKVEFLETPKNDFGAYQAIIFTSANGVRAFCAKNQACGLPIYVVGNNTRDVALQNGLESVTSADGDVKKLSDTIISTLNPNNGPLLYLSGDHVAGSLVTDLSHAGFKINHQKIYAVAAAQSLSVDTKNLLKKGAIDYIPFYSPRSGLIFKLLIEAAGLQKTLTAVSALCLSPAVEKEISTLDWEKILTAQKPTQENMFELIDIKF